MRNEVSDYIVTMVLLFLFIAVSDMPLNLPTGSNLELMSLPPEARFFSLSYKLFATRFEIKLTLRMVLEV